MTTLRITIAVNSCDEADFMMRSSIKKEESLWMSHFQRIGLAYRESDAIKKRITENPYAAKAHFIKIMIGIGLCLHDAEALLGAKNWNLRMELAWSFLEPAERKQAQSIDYDRCENYWPNLDFLTKAVGLSLRYA